MIQKCRDWVPFCCCWSVAKLFLTLCDPMDCSTPGSPSFTISQSLLKFTSVELAMLTISSSATAFSFCLQCFPASRFHYQWLLVQFSSVTQSCLTLQPHGQQHARPPCPSPTPRAYSNSCPLHQWCYPTISFSSCLQSFPASGSFPVTWFFASGGQSTGVSASASVLTMNIQDWYPLGWTDLICLQSKGLSRVFSNATIQKHQFFSAQISL